MKRTDNKKKFILLAIVVLLITVIGATYAYFVAQKGSDGSAQIEVGAGTTDLLSFTSGDKINIIANQDNFKKGGESIIDKSTVTATLTPNNTTNIAHDTYNVYLIIENNDFEYTTSELKPELMLKVINPLGEEITEMKGFNYDDGFDITNKKRAAYPLVKGYEIDANGEAKVDEWQIEVTLVNLESDQNSNAGKTFTGSILITSKDVETYDLAEIKNMISTTTYKSVNASLELDEGTNTIDKYYYAITETDEEPIALSISEVADALSYSYHESEEATYEFTTTDDGEKLKPNQNYKIFSYAKDKEGYQSNIYETIVTTDNYEIPVINDVTYSVMPTSITLNVSATPKSAKIIKYQYKLNSEEEWHDFTETTYTINSLNEATVYELKVRAIDEEEMPSNPWEKSITTGKYGSEEFPYEIKTVEDLVKLSNDVNNGKTFANEYFKLMDNIDFQNKDSYQNADAIVEKDINGNGSNETLQVELTTKFGFTPIGFGGKYFSGIFDGNNKKISNLHISYNVNNNYLALFGWVKDGTIKNLTVGGEVTTEVASPLGGIVNRLENSTMENCINEVNVTSSFSTFAVGGVASWVYSGDSYIKKCKNLGTVKGGGYLGGIVAGHQGGTLTIENSTNEGKIETNIGTKAGGIVGSLNASAQELIIKNSSNNGEILSSVNNELEKGIGGIIGYDQTGNITLDNVINKGTVSNPRKAYTNFIRDNVGGLIGYNPSVNNTIKITNSHNEGKIIGGTYTGGIIGYNVGTLILNKTYNTSLIDTSGQTFTATTRASTVTGGLIGFSNGANAYAIILNSFNKGEVRGTDVISGILGLSNNATSFNYIINSYNKGKVVINTASDAAGIGRTTTANNTAYINNVYNAGDVKGVRATYGLGYVITPNNTMLNSYYKDKNSDGTAITGANTGNTPTALSDAILKNQTAMSGTKYFYTALNDNIKNINLKNINTLLNGYTLESWKKGTDGYPALNFE